MNVPAAIQLRRGSCFLLAALLLALPARSLETSPQSIEFKTVKDSAVIKLTEGGQAVPASAIQSVKLYVGAHDYDHMISVGKADGAITVRPTEMLELGTYDLTIVTAHGTAKVNVLALLTIVDDSFEARAERQGVTVDAVKAQLGISQSLGRERIDLNLPPLYYVGQTLELNIPLAPGRTAFWSVNGAPKRVEQGPIRYLFEQPGIYDVGYLEKQGDATIAVGLGTTTVAPEPPIPVKVAPGVQLTLRAPEGYAAFSWSADGEAAGSDAAWTRTFTEPGDHRISVRASAPKPDTKQAFRILTYSVRVE